MHTGTFICELYSAYLKSFHLIHIIRRFILHVKHTALLDRGRQDDIDTNSETQVPQGAGSHAFGRRIHSRLCP